MKAHCKRPNALRTAHTTAEAAIGLVGFEPTACRRGDRSTEKRISGWWDLNPRSPGPEPGAIPSFATARNDPMSLQDASPYFAYFDLNRKDRACLPALLHQSTPVKSAVLSQPTSQLSHSSTITLGRRKRCRFAGRFGSVARNYFVGPDEKR